MSTAVTLNDDDWQEVVAPGSSWAFVSVSHGDALFHIAGSAPAQGNRTGHQVTGGFGIERSQFQGGLYARGRGTVIVDQG